MFRLLLGGKGCEFTAQICLDICLHYGSVDIVQNQDRTRADISRRDMIFSLRLLGSGRRVTKNVIGVSNVQPPVLRPVGCETTADDTTIEGCMPSFERDMDSLTHNSDYGSELDDAQAGIHMRIMQHSNPPLLHISLGFMRSQVSLVKIQVDCIAL
jgi:hypothetical protein